MQRHLYFRAGLLLMHLDAPGLVADVLPCHAMHIATPLSVYSISANAVRCLVPMGQRFSYWWISSSVHDLISLILVRLIPVDGVARDPFFLQRVLDQDAQLFQRIQFCRRPVVIGGKHRLDALLIEARHRTPAMFAPDGVEPRAGSPPSWLVADL